MIYALIVLTLASMYACYRIASSRQANVRFWVFMGLLFGPFAIPFAFLARPKR